MTKKFIGGLLSVVVITSLLAFLFYHATIRDQQRERDFHNRCAAKGGIVAIHGGLFASQECYGADGHWIPLKNNPYKH